MVVVLLLWSAAVSYFRLVAAKEKAGPGQPWFADFVGLGWLRATTERGKRYAHYAVIMLWLAIPLMLLTFFAVNGLTQTTGGAKVR